MIISLTSYKYGETILINLNNVIMIQPADNGSTLSMVNDGHIVVRETVDDIAHTVEREKRHETDAI